VCGRYARRGDKQKIAGALHVKDVPDFAMADADYNIAPTTFQPIIRESRDTGEREVVLARWCLIPLFTNGVRPARASVKFAA
jgi:putative SOS response-associated peptidase YedK